MEEPSGQNASAIWPQVVVHGTTTNFIYQPRADFWDGHHVTARDAVAVQSAGQSQPTFGVLTVQAVTLVDKSAKTVALEQIQISGGDFPSDRAKNGEYLRSIRDAFPKELTGLSLEQLESSFVAPPPPGGQAAQALNNSPPEMIFSTQPAVLVYVDGPPVFRAVPGTSLERAINSRALLLKDKNGELYLHLLDGYLQAPKLDGPWTVAQKAPDGAAEAESQALSAATPVDLLDGRTDPTNSPPHLTPQNAPMIYTATRPTELILFRGPPDFVPIPGTGLLYVENTTGNVFKSTADQKWYVLLSGRWYRAASEQGPWDFVRPDRLPTDFAGIPDDSPKENVKASVPGTTQASEALIANSIPQSAKVPQGTKMGKPQIDGAPILTPIAGTPLSYVANSGTPIIRVDEHTWYACENGVWYDATSLEGPWVAASSVPAVIYTIPPASPLHYLTYVQVYGASPQEVYEGYTPGYLGTEVEDGVVVYGTGYYYPPWVGAEWYGWPCTWGFGWGPCWTPWDDWCFDFGFGWGCGFGTFGWWRCHPLGPWWGPCRNWHAFAGSFAWRRGATASTAGNIYRRPDSVAARSVASRPAVRPEGAASFGRAYNSRTGALAGGQRASVRNVYAGVAGQGPSTAHWSRGAMDTRAVRPAAMQYGPYSRSVSGSMGAGRSSARPGYYGGGVSGRPFGYSNGGGYSRGYSGAASRGSGGYGGGGGHSAGRGGGGGGHSGGSGHGGNGR